MPTAAALPLSAMARTHCTARRGECINAHLGCSSSSLPFKCPIQCRFQLFLLLLHKQATTNHLLSELPHWRGNIENGTSRQFIRHWASRLLSGGKHVESIQFWVIVVSFIVVSYFFMFNSIKSRTRPVWQNACQMKDLSLKDLKMTIVDKDKVLFSSVGLSLQADWPACPSLATDRSKWSFLSSLPLSTVHFLVK